MYAKSSVFYRNRRQKRWISVAKNRKYLAVSCIFEPPQNRLNGAPQVVFVSPLCFATTWYTTTLLESTVFLVFVFSSGAGVKI